MKLLRLLSWRTGLEIEAIKTFICEKCAVRVDGMVFEALVNGTVVMKDDNKFEVDYFEFIHKNEFAKVDGEKYIRIDTHTNKITFVTRMKSKIEMAFKQCLIEKAKTSETEWCYHDFG